MIFPLLEEPPEELFDGLLADGDRDRPEPRVQILDQRLEVFARDRVDSRRHPLANEEVGYLLGSLRLGLDRSGRAASRSKQSLPGRGQSGDVDAYSVLDLH